jgi:glycosyltransferase involved in cell wall biosynthesis
MIKVLINVPNTKNWVGGLNYFVNLAEALKSLPKSKIELILLSPGDTLPPPLNSLRQLSHPSTPRPNEHILRKILRRLRRIAKIKDPIVDILVKEGIQLFSHGYYLGNTSPIPTLAWIPDLQHKFLPHFFTATECQKRDAVYESLITNLQPILFSSHSALNDFNKFYPDHKCTTYVLQFVTKASLYPSEETMQKVLNEYNINEPFFHIPNQLWAHKNHSVVVEALKILKEKGKCPLIISTGFTEDYRDTNYFPSILKKVQDYGLNDRIRFLGLIEYESMSSLMRKSIALINPSLFEGWSTTVEEAKSLGKKILLSDIPVHREQLPERGQYFKPHEPTELAKLILGSLEVYSLSQESVYEEKAKTDLPARMMAFGLNYESIVMDIIEKSQSLKGVAN